MFLWFLGIVKHSLSSQPTLHLIHKGMKKIIAISTLILACASTAFAEFSERKLESALKKASDSDKKIAFVFWQDYYLPNCPKCIQKVDAANGAIKKAIPRSSVVMVEIEKGDKNLDKLPSAVSAEGKLPRIVVTDASGEKVVATLDGTPDRDKAKAFKEEIETAD